MYVRVPLYSVMVRFVVNEGIGKGMNRTKQMNGNTASGLHLSIIFFAKKHNFTSDELRF